MYRILLKPKICLLVVVLLLCGVLLILQMYWLIFLVAAFTLMLKIPFLAERNSWVFLLAWLMVAIVLAIFVRLFFCEIYVIPSTSMENTLLKGDRVIVNKLAYGPGFPVNLQDVPWSNVFVPRLYRQNLLLGKAHRLGGYSKVKRNDLVVFKSPLDKRQKIIKRCLALPGDSIGLINGNALVNGKLITIVPTAKFLYEVRLKDLKTISALIVDLGVKFTESGSITRPSRSKVFLNAFQLEQLTSKGCSLSVVFDLPRKTFWKKNSFDGTYGHSLVVPKKGMRIDLTKQAADIYLNFIKAYETPDVLADIQRGLKFYSFKKDYYFFLGDNRSKSVDSRTFGFIPDDFIEGKAIKFF